MSLPHSPYLLSLPPLSVSLSLTHAFSLCSLSLSFMKSWTLCKLRLYRFLPVGNLNVCFLVIMHIFSYFYLVKLWDKRKKSERNTKYVHKEKLMIFIFCCLHFCNVFSQQKEKLWLTSKAYFPHRRGGVGGGEFDECTFLERKKGFTLLTLLSGKKVNNASFKRMLLL